MERSIRENHKAQVKGNSLDEDIEKFKLKLKEKESAMKANAIEAEAHQKNMELKSDLERQRTINNDLQSDLNNLKLEMMAVKDQLEESAKLLDALEDENNASLSKVRFLEDRIEKLQSEKEYQQMYIAQMEENFKAQMFELREVWL
jgi:predicted RNase H-like nuclease (RuvC/YqgF family)